AEVSIVGVEAAPRHVSPPRAREHRLDPLDQTAAVQRRLHGVAAGHREADRAPWAVALLASAALTTPCGVAHSSSWRSTSATGVGVAVSPVTFHARPPLTTWTCRASPTARAPPPRGGLAAPGRHPRPGARLLLSHRGRLVMDGAREGGDVEPGQCRSRHRALA